MVVLGQSAINESEYLYPEMFWFHCNGCYCQPESGVVLRFFITNCSHIYCEKCVNECTKERCKVCQSQCTTLELGTKLQKEVENLFEEPTVMVQKCFKQINQTLEFQKSHQRRWSRHLKSMLRQQTTQLKDVKKLVNQYRILEKESMELKKENSYLKCLLAKNDPGLRAASRSGASYPGMSPNRSPFSKTPSAFGKGAQPSSSFNPQMSNNPQSSSIMNQPGRILMRTPPSEGRLGTTRSRLSYMTVGSAESKPATPLTIPRPIYLGNSE